MTEIVVTLVAANGCGPATSTTNKNRLHSLQTRASRLINKPGHNLIFQELRWLSLQHKRDFHKIVTVYTRIYCMAPIPV